MKNKIISGLILTLSFTNLSGQDKDATSEKLLNDLSRKTKSYTSVKADFTYSLENSKAGVSEQKKGTLVLSGDKYSMSAAGQVVICDGKTIWTYLKESNEVQINAVDNSDDALTPNKLLSSYTTNYKSKMTKLKNQPAGTESVELTPNKPKNFTKAILTIEKAKLQIHSFSIYEKNGNVFTYKISNFQTNVPVTAADFTFDPKKYPGVEINDMR